MATARAGHNDAQQAARLNWFTGSAYAAAPTTIYLGLYAGKMPLSDGSGGTEVSPATRPAITFGAVTQDANGRHYMANNAVSNIVLTNTSAAEIIGFSIFSANSGGTPLYYDRLPGAFQVAAGATVSIPAGAIRVYAEPPTI